LAAAARYRHPAPGYQAANILVARNGYAKLADFLAWRKLEERATPEQ